MYVWELYECGEPIGLFISRERAIKERDAWLKYLNAPANEWVKVRSSLDLAIMTRADYTIRQVKVKE